MRKVIAVMLVAGFVFTGLSAVAQTSTPEDDAAHRAVKGTFQTVGEAAKGTTETAVSPIVAFWRWMKGEGTPDKMVTDPVTQGGKTVYDASANTGRTVAGQNQ